MKPNKNRLYACRPRLTGLEDRVVPTGTTVITHGYSLSSQFGSDSWIRAMGNAIADRSPDPDVFLMYDFAAGELRFDGGANVPSNFVAGSAEYIVFVSWETASSRSTPGWAETVADGLYGTLRRYGLADADHPLHFIGHSYGTVVNSETIQRLGYLDGLTVDQMTTLDPHDFNEVFSGFISPNFEANVKQPDVHVWSNITYADNYYNTAGSSTFFNPLPHGRALDGPLTQAAINVNLSGLAGFNINGSLPHTRVHEYYALTIDPNIELFDPTVNTSTWFGAGPSTDYGFRYSRIGGTSVERATYYSGYTQRIDPSSPPDNSALDVGKDPPTRIYNGDFFNTSVASGQLPGFVGSPQITGAPTNPAALLNNSGKSFTHLPVLFPLNTATFEFDFNVLSAAASGALSVSFQRDGDNQVFTFTDNDILTSNGSATRTIDLSNFALLPQLAGRMASISFTLVGTPASASISVDNLRMTTSAASVGGPYFVGSGSSVELSGSAFGYPGPLSDLRFAWDLDNDGVFSESGPSALNGIEFGTNPVFDASTFSGPASAEIRLYVTGPQGFSAFSSGIVDVLSQPAIESVVVNDSSSQRSMVSSITVTFAGLVNMPISPSAFQLAGGQGSVVLDIDSSNSTPNKTIARITFAGPGTEFGSLKDGLYDFTIIGALIFDAAGQSLSADHHELFHRLYGDADGNGQIDLLDFALFRSAFNPNYNIIFDFDGSGTVDLQDFSQFHARYGMGI